MPRQRVHPDQLPELDQIAFAGYVEGLRDASWQGDPALARLGYTLGVVLQHGIGIFIVEWAARDANTRNFIETAIGHSIGEISDAMRGFRRFIVACTEEARPLMAGEAIKGAPRKVAPAHRDSQRSGVNAA